jgi:segregation and condensation protein B
MLINEKYMITGRIESILFASGKPIKYSVLKKLLGSSDEVLKEAIDVLRSRYNENTSGINLLENEDRIQLVTNPFFTDDVKNFVKDDIGGELTRPSLETLTIIAYKGPITKPEIEQIRGVNCSVILRNLLIRGLINENESKEKLQAVYSASDEFLRHLGLRSIEELPEYKEMNSNKETDALLKQLSQEIGEI